MRGITIWQPWASAIAAGFKQVENREWTTSYRGTMAIHAGTSTREIELLPVAARAPSQATLRGIVREMQERLGSFDKLPRGLILGVVDLVWAGSVAEYGAGYGEDPYAYGPYCWRLENTRRLVQPISTTGSLGLWPVPEGIVRLIENDLAAQTHAPIDTEKPGRDADH